VTTGEGEQAARVWEAMRTLVLERHDRRDEVCAAMGMSFFRVKVLRRVAAEPVTMGLLAERLGSDPPYVTIVVDDLERRGLVLRSPDPDDRRRKIVSVTEAGVRAAAEAGALLAAPPPVLLALPADRLAVLSEILADLLEPSVR
jgi:DNA-binding MarR family transcriptional regulator